MKKIVYWWITKLLPGQMMPMHTDPHTHEEQTCKRYWVPLQDYVPGHVFIYGESMMQNYKRGDVFQYENSTDEHGAAITLRAKKDGVSPQEIVDKYHNINKKAFADFGIDFSIYHRTSDAKIYLCCWHFFFQIIN